MAKVATEEEAAKKSASKQRKGQKSKKKSSFEKPPSECPLDLSLLPEEVPIEVKPVVDGIILVLDDQSLITSADAILVALESRIDI